MRSRWQVLAERYRGRSGPAMLAAMKLHEELQDSQLDFIATQKMFFVATAPRSDDGHVNVSPKGLDSFAVLGPTRVAYIDLGGSGIETQAHLQENGRICLMFCAFEGPPNILRLYGQGRVRVWGSPEFDALRGHFPAIDVPVRAILEIDVRRTQDSCGWGVPLYDYQGQRERLVDHNSRSTQEEFFERRLTRNARSLDGLPGLRATPEPGREA